MNSASTITKPRATRKRSGFYFTKPDGTERRLREKPRVRIVDSANGIYSVRSDSDHEVWYQVDSITGLCTCEAGQTARGCWHRAYISHLFAPPALPLPEPVNPWHNDASGLMMLFEPSGRVGRRAAS